MSPDLVWGGVAALVVFLELAGIFNTRPGDTISELTRKHFRTNTRGGRLAFGLVWPAFALWFLWHILWQHPRKKA